jgi:uncharacterized protein HemX
MMMLTPFQSPDAPTIARQRGGALGWLLMAIAAIAIGAGGAIAAFGNMWVR